MTTTTTMLWGSRLNDLTLLLRILRLSSHVEQRLH
jgi:hypothetical protein